MAETGNLDRERQREVSELLRGMYDKMAADLVAIGEGDGVNITEESSDFEATVHLPGFVLWVKRTYDRQGAFNMQFDDLRKVVLTVGRTSAHHEWFHRRLAEKLNNPMLQLAFDFDRLESCLVEDNFGFDGLLEAQIDTIGNDKTKFPGKSLGKKPEFRSLYLDFAKALIETMQEFWDSFGREIVEKHVQAQTGQYTGETADAAKKIVE